MKLHFYKIRNDKTGQFLTQYKSYSSTQYCWDEDGDVFPTLDRAKERLQALSKQGRLYEIENASFTRYSCSPVDRKPCIDFIADYGQTKKLIGKMKMLSLNELVLEIKGGD